MNGPPSGRHGRSSSSLPPRHGWVHCRTDCGKRHNIDMLTKSEGAGACTRIRCRCRTDGWPLVSTGAAQDSNGEVVFTFLQHRRCPSPKKGGHAANSTCPARTFSPWTSYLPPAWAKLLSYPRWSSAPSPPSRPTEPARPKERVVSTPGLASRSDHSLTVKGRLVAILE